MNGVHELVKLAYYKKFSDPDYNLIDDEGENLHNNFPRWEHLIQPKEKQLDIIENNDDIFIDSE